MKKLRKKLMSIILAIVLILSLGSPAIAKETAKTAGGATILDAKSIEESENQRFEDGEFLGINADESFEGTIYEDYIDDEYGEDVFPVSEDEFISEEEIHFLQELYNALSTEEKEMFDCLLATDEELKTLHQEYVDPSYEEPEDLSVLTEFNSEVEPLTRSVKYRAASSANPLTTLNKTLVSLGLSSAVVYALNAVAVSVNGAIAEGPLVYGKAVAIIVTVAAVGVLAANWEQVAPVFPKIVKAFQVCFAQSASVIASAFQELKKQAEKKAQEEPTVIVNGTKVKVNGKEYNCKVKISDLTEAQKRQKRYMPAVRANGNVYVATNTNLTYSQAQAIQSLNNEWFGLYATSKSDAQVICGGNRARHDSNESHGAGYYPHYHHYSKLKEKCHVWYS